MKRSGHQLGVEPDLGWYGWYRSPKDQFLFGNTRTTPLRCGAVRVVRYSIACERSSVDTRINS